MKLNEDKKTEYVPNVTDVGTNVSDVVVCATRVVFEKNGFVIFYCNGNFSVKGNFSGNIVPGLNYKVSGLVGTYGRIYQISADSIELVKDEESIYPIIASFLMNNFDGIGERIGLAIAKAYGKDILEELLKRPKSVAKSIHGLSEKRAVSMSDKISESQHYLEIVLNLRLLGLSEDQASKAYKMFGLTCYDEISTNPYKLLRIEGIGFESCEYIAEGLDIDKFDPMRIHGAILSVLNEVHYVSGNTYVMPGVLKNGVRNIIFDRSNRPCDTCNKQITCNLITSECELFEASFKEALELGVRLDDTVIYKFKDNKCTSCEFDDPDSRIALKRIFKIEVGIKGMIESFLNADIPKFNEKLARSVVKDLSEKSGIELDAKQTEAILMCMREPFSIITGGPGTGKTTITGILSSHFSNEKIPCYFCAPTGRAAKRLSEAIGREAHTIHRLLEVRPGDGEQGFVFGRNHNNPLDARVIVVDEASMVDNSLFLALLRAIKPDSSLILIGDPDQLPSVGPGKLLSDLLSCSSIPRAELIYVFRQKDESSIAANAYRILKGESLIGNDDDFVIINTKSEEESLKKVFELQEKYRKEDFVILSPTKQYTIGTAILNQEIQALEADMTLPSITVGSRGVFREKDRVMQIKNDYNIEFYDTLTGEVDTGVYNGELGTIESINELEKSVKVLFDDGRKVTYTSKTLEDIDLAYAMTVHKAQGCEFDYIVLCLGKMSSKLINRKILYTAVTRGKKKVIIIDGAGILGRMIKSSDKDQRLSSLKDFLAIVDNKRSKKRADLEGST